MRRTNVFAAAVALYAAFGVAPAPAQTPDVSVGAQYDSTHAYVAPADFDRFVGSFVATFGGKASQRATVTVTPASSQTYSQVALTPAGTVSAFGFLTPIPFPFGSERCGYMVTDLDAAVTAARSDGASILVAQFSDPIGRDALIQWPGGVVMQLYVHFTRPVYPALATIPENRFYLAPEDADAFLRDFEAFAHARVVADVSNAPGVEIGRPGYSYRRVDLQSGFGNVRAIVTDGHLPYPYGRERTGYAVDNLDDTLRKAIASGASILMPAFTSGGRTSAMIEFPGGYVAEIHSATR
jgi:predicted enzyme related to lactoylglutathione lyase